MHPAATTTAERPRLLLPDAPAVVSRAGRLTLLTVDGELIDDISPENLRPHLEHTPPLVCHAAEIAHRLGFGQMPLSARFPAYDVLELFAFVHPGRKTVPTPAGCAAALHLMEPETPEDACLALRHIARHLLSDLMSLAGSQDGADLAALAAMMGLHGRPQRIIAEEGNPNGRDPDGWSWAAPVLAALGRDDRPPTRRDIRRALGKWKDLPEWAQHAPPSPPGHHGIDREEAEDQLSRLLARRKKQPRAEQKAYAAAVATAFAPTDRPDETHVLLAEAGTGTGKTLGYLAPALRWAEKNDGAVWVSTYTRALQRQIEAELNDAFPDEASRNRAVVTRKGRENYLCLLNLEEAAESLNVLGTESQAVTLGLLLRWVGVTRDGDFGGADFPGWLPGLLGWGRVHAYADRHGECLYAGCPHFDRCFVEKSVRRAARARIVIANHALVMHQTALSDRDDDTPTRFVFDEGHHLFDAADAAFAADLTGTAGADLRRWLIGPEGGQRRRARGLQKRLEAFLSDDDDLRHHLEDVLAAAQGLPGPQWRQRIGSQAPRGPMEKFLAALARHILARNTETRGFYSLEADPHPLSPELVPLAMTLSHRLSDLARPMAALARRLQKKLEEDAETLDSRDRDRLRFVAKSLERRHDHILRPWIDMLDSLTHPPAASGPNGDPNSARDITHVDWIEITRIDGNDHDVGFYRRHINPGTAFAQSLRGKAKGVVVTSATLRDPSPEDDDGWQQIITRSGAADFYPQPQTPPRTFQSASPFDYAAQSRIFIIGDVDKNNAAESAAAMAALMAASGGGGLGLFTAIQRLRQAHPLLRDRLAGDDIPLLAQHIDPLDTATLIDIFRAEEKACLIGTDATRDGIDVPGRSLRLVVYDRVPWPRPTLLHKARRAWFGRGYDDTLTRFKLKQAFGRLVRQAEDRGVLAVLDGALPTRLLSSFPAETPVARVGLKEAIADIRAFLSQTEKPTA